MVRKFWVSRKRATQMTSKTGREVVVVIGRREDKFGRSLSHDVLAYRGPGNPHNQCSQEKHEHRERERLQAKSSLGS